MASSKTIIEYPPKLMQKVKKAAETRLRRRKDWLQKYGVKKDAKLIISCRDPMLNHYENQRYHEEYSILCSLHWKKSKHVGDYFTIQNFGKNPAFLPDSLEEDITFSDFGLCHAVEQVIHTLGFTRPTAVQLLAMPTILRGCNTAIAAETGSGKTLAYVAPIITHLQALGKSHGPPRSANPRSLFLVPGLELVDQTTEFVKAFASHTHLNVGCLLNIDQANPSAMFREPLDILVGTPGMVSKYSQDGTINLTYLNHVVIDEADTMLDDSFSPDVLSILQDFQIKIHETPAGVSQPGTQLVLASATMPRNLNEMLSGVVYPGNLEVVTTAGLHKLMPHISQKFMRVNPDLKQEELLKLVRMHFKKNQPVQVFVNDNRTCANIGTFLQDNEIPARILCKHVDRIDRLKVFNDFQMGKFNVLVTTDVGSRGLNTKRVSHVINYQFPEHMADYIHRIGRVGRVGSSRPGHVTSFVSSREEVEMTQVIEESVRKRTSLPDIDGNIKRKLLMKKSGGFIDELHDGESHI